MKNLKNNTRQHVHAIIKYNIQDKQVVTYFQGADAVYKMLSPKNIQRMSYDTLGSFVCMLNRSKKESKSPEKLKGIVVYADEQVEYNGKALEIPSRITKMSQHVLDYIEAEI